MWKNTIIDVWLGSKYFSACYPTQHKRIKEFPWLVEGMVTIKMYTPSVNKGVNINCETLKVKLKTGMGKTGIWVTLALNKK